LGYCEVREIFLFQLQVQLGAALAGACAVTIFDFGGLADFLQH
jgi:hypothetical protein